jgi:triosephosphate isomerase (TIM)
MTASRRPLVAANWKMNKTNAEAREFVDTLLAGLGRVTDTVDVVVCPPFTALHTVADMAQGSTVRVAAQNMHEQDTGAFTGEVSAPMLLELGVAGVVLGHSERREHFAETDAALGRKVPRALAAELLPILCVGETEAERDAQETERKLRRQVEVDLAEVESARLSDVVIAYEPIWAIGTGKTATPDQARSAIEFIRALIGERDPEAAQEIRILYGGSVDPDNAPELMHQPGIDGALVGGASLHPDRFLAIAAAART